MNKADNNGGKFRKKKIYYTAISNEVLRDESLSLKAKGLYCLIQSYLNIDGFTLYKNYLIKINQDGKASFDTAWKQLKEHGYLVQYEMHDDRGNWVYEYELLDHVVKPVKKAPAKKTQDKSNKKQAKKHQVACNEELVRYFTESLGKAPNASERKELSQFSEVMTEDVIARAFSIAEYHNANWPYTRTILADWLQKGVKNLATYFDFLKEK